MMPSSSLEWFVVAALAVWRVTHLLVDEDGPGRVFARLREATAAGGGALTRFAAEILGCFYCASIWVAGALCWAIEADGALQRALIWLGLSGVACLLERSAPLRAAAPAVFYEGHEEDRHELLRRSAGRHGDGDDSRHDA